MMDYTPVILSRLRQEDYQFEASLGYIVKLFKKINSPAPVAQATEETEIRRITV
jgi:hypothetical protein